MRRIMWSTMAALAALGSVPALRATAGDCCGDCGGCVRKVCKVVCEEKEIKDTCYGCECDAVCLPGCARRGCLHRECVCGQEGCDGCCGDSCDQAPHCVLEWFDWCPSRCAHLRHINKLVKYEVSKKVPSYKWVVEEVCDDCCGCGHGDGCGAHRDAVPAEPDMGSPSDTPPVPPPPVPQARLGERTDANQARFRN